ncbi:MAG: SDR family NAD(P)-dependent oxidoreductase [Deltaproteobacteria bacterium]|nr:SDR family NAD(P)-dependent oxidoreductase [Deltaproteobacteria bacterium]
MGDFWRGRAVVITGASSGIGKDLGLLLASRGARVALVARRRELLAEVEAGCVAAGGEAVSFAADVADARAMEAVRDEVLGRWGFADVVVANAGVGGLNPGATFSLDLHRRFVEVNCMGLANTLVPFIPSMVARRAGRLVGVSSLAAFRGLPAAASYSSTKAQQGVFLESLRVDLRQAGVAVTSIHPGFVETPMTDHDEFRMPFKIPVRRSSVLIARAIERRRRAYLYPWPMKLLTYLNRSLPGWLYDRLIPRLSGQSGHVSARAF